MTGRAPPTRLVARAMGDFLITSARAWARPHGGDVMGAFIFCTILGANLDHLGYAGPLAAAAAAGDDDGVAPRRPISAHAIAESLSLPYETVRRRTVRMVADGMVSRTRAGLVVVAAALRDPAMVAAMREVRGLLDGVFGVLTSIGFDLTAFAAGGQTDGAPPPDALVARIVLDTQIRSLEMIAPIFGDVIGAYVFCGVLRANVSDMLHDPALAWRYATEDAPPPDALRKPITIRELARDLAMPFETVRRQVRRMIDAEALVVTADGGVIAPTAVVVGDNATYQNGKLAVEFFRMLAALARIGLFADQGSSSDASP